MSRPRSQLIPTANRRLAPSADNHRRTLRVSCVANRPPTLGNVPSRPPGVYPVPTGPREDRLLRDDLTIPILGRVDRAASGSRSADQTGTWL